MFIEIAPDILEKFATISDRMPKLYYHPLWIARKFFWLRLRYIYRYVVRQVPNRHTCLDFGCGTGVFLPTLATVFQEVTAIDLEIAEATELLQRFDASNVRLVQGDLTSMQIAEKSFDVITAADVLEHFSSLAEPVAKIHAWLKDDGLLLTSLPTEGFFTKSTRILGGYQKPFDHYHSAAEVERFLIKNGFRRTWSRLIIPIVPLYAVSAWRKSEC